MVLGAAYMFAAFRHTNREWLQGLTPQVFGEYLDYLLGEHCWMLVARDGGGRTLSFPGMAAGPRLRHGHQARRQQKGGSGRSVPQGRAQRGAKGPPGQGEVFYHASRAAGSGATAACGSGAAPKGGQTRSTSLPRQ